MISDTPALFAIGVPMVFGLGMWLRRARSDARLAPRKKVTSAVLFSPNEIEFYNRLLRALPDCHVLAQVSLGSLLRPIAITLSDKGRERREFKRIRSSYSEKIADYVVCDTLLRVLTIIELDDFTQNAEEDTKRDRMLHEAGYKVIRFDVRNKPPMEEIRRRVFGGPEAP